jgi:large subunit ribosomal protein L30
MYLVIRIRGTTGVLSGIASTLEMLRLNRISHAVLVEENPSYEGMLQKAKDYITWGEVNVETVAELLENEHVALVENRFVHSCCVKKRRKGMK